MRQPLENTVKQISESLEINERFHKKGFVFPNHWHNYFEFEIVLDGEYEHNVFNEKRIARRGSAWIMSHLDYHSFVCTEDAHILNISFTGKNIDKSIIDALSATMGGFLCEFSDPETIRLSEKAQHALIEMEEKAPFWSLKVKSIVESIIIEVVRRCNGASDLLNYRRTGVLQNVVSYIHSNYSADLSLTALSKMFDLSSGHLGLMFSKAFGVSLSTYVTRVRIKQSCNLLESSKLSTKEIAYICGFKSTEYFHYSFKNQMKMTPNTYRKEYLSQCEPVHIRHRDEPVEKACPKHQ